MTKFDRFLFKVSVLIFISGYISLMVRHLNEIKVVAFFQNPDEAAFIVIPLIIIVVLAFKDKKNKGD